MNSDRRPTLICHIIFRLDFGGLENGLVNLINRLPPDRYRHCIVCLKYASDFRQRIERDDVDIYELDKQDGKDPAVYWRLFRLLRKIRPDIVHARNIPTIDMLAIARLAGVRRLVYSEHGLDAMESDGRHAKYNAIRRASRFITRQYVTVSHDLANWLTGEVGIDDSRVTPIHNGVDTQRFHPGARAPGVLPEDFAGDDCVVFGTIGRIAEIKDQMNLALAFVELNKLAPRRAARARLALIGDGDDRARIEECLTAAGVADRCWLPGYRDDTAELYRAFDVFVLPSRREGISNTILEAMASGLPVVATHVGGNPEIVSDGTTGTLVPARDPHALATAMLEYLDDEALRQAHARAGRESALANFSMEAMVQNYSAVYEKA